MADTWGIGLADSVKGKDGKVIGCNEIHLCPLIAGDLNNFHSPQTNGTSSKLLQTLQ